MKKPLLIVVITLMLLVVGLSGCSEQLLEKGAITINGPNDTSISLPSDSTDSEAEFSIEELNKSMVSYMPTWSNDIISLYDFSVDRPIKEAVTIRIPIPDAELAVLGHYHNWNWEAMPFNEENGKAVVEVDNLSFFGWLDVSNFADKVLDFFTLRWMDKEPTLTHDSDIVVDESKTYDLISGSGQLIEGDTVKITIYNDAPVHLEVYPVDYPSKSFEFKKTGIYTYEEYTILEPNSYGEWTTDLVIDESVTFNAYFSDLALAAFVGDLIPYGRLARGITEASLFARNGREMKWADVKGLLIFPTFAEAAKTVKEMKDMPDALLETASMVFTRVESDEEEKFTTMPDGVKVTGDIDEIEILNIEISTEEQIFVGGFGGGYGWKKVFDGFVIPRFLCRYRVNGTAKNIADKTMNSMKISVQYLDEWGAGLHQESVSFPDVSDGEIRDFEILWQEPGGPRWDSYAFFQVKSCSLEVAAYFL